MRPVFYGGKLVGPLDRIVRPMHDKLTMQRRWPLYALFVKSKAGGQIKICSIGRSVDELYNRSMPVFVQDNPHLLIGFYQVPPSYADFKRDFRRMDNCSAGNGGSAANRYSLHSSSWSSG